MALEAPRVTLTECFARDGLQSLDRIFTTAEKLDVLDGIVAAGFRRIEVTSFVPAKVLPQFFDAEPVTAALRARTDAQLIAFVPNTQGMERCAELKRAGVGPDTALIVVSASEDHNQRNLRRPVAETMVDHRHLAEVAHAADVTLCGSISVAFGCPYSGDVPIERVLMLIEHYKGIGVREIQFGDTTGMANPAQVRRFFARVLPRLDGIVAVAHFHDTRGAAIANSLAAIDAGVRVVDTSLGGLGGRPPGQRVQQSGPTGNTSSEDLAMLLAEMGYETGLDVDGLLSVGRHLEQMAGQALFSHGVHAGPVPHMAPAFVPAAVA